MSGRISSVSRLGASLLTLAISAPGWTQVAVAQSQADQGPQAQAGTPNPAGEELAVAQLQEIVVTAQKRTELLQNVPMTVDALQGAQLQQLAIYDFQDISQLSPGLVISNEDINNQTIQIRGISFEAFSGATAGVTVYWNGAEVDPQSALRPMFDLSQIEVLRGAQGTLRGDTSPAGQITITTRRPDLDRFGIDVQQTVGNLSTLNTQGGISIPIVNHVLGLRLAGLFDRNNENGVVDFANGRHNRTETHAGRATLEFRPNRDFDATLIYQHEQGHNTTYSPVTGPGDGAQFPLTPNGPAFTPSDMTANDPGPFDYAHKLDIGVLDVKWSFDGYQLNYTGSYWDDENSFFQSADPDNIIPNPPASAFMGTYPALAQSVPVESSRQYSNELRFESTQGSFWNYMFGAYYAHETASTHVYQGSDTANSTAVPGAIVEQPGIDVVHVYIPETLATEALFTDQRFQLTADDLLEAGFRYTRYPQERQSTLYIGFTPTLFGAYGIPPAYIPAVCGTFFPGATYANGYCNQAPVNTIPASASAVNWVGRTGSLSYSHHFDRDLMAYVRYARSYRPGGPDVAEEAALPLQYLTFQSETSDSYELGVKSTLFHDREQIFGDVFYQKFRGFIASDQEIIYTATPNPAGTPTCPTGVGGACNVDLTTNGPAVAEGFELSARTKFTDNLYTQLNVAYADAHYTDALLPCNDYTNRGVPNQSGPPAVQPNKFVSTCVTSQPLSTTGRWQISANGDYSHPIGDRMAWFARTLVNFSSAPTELPGSGYARPSSVLVNAFLGLRSRGTEQSWSGFLYVRNLFDSRHYTISSNVPVVNGVPSGYYGFQFLPPREYGVTLSYDY